MNEKIIDLIKEEAQSYFNLACPSHDWSHVERVYNLCLDIGKKEKADLDILKLAAFLHDIGRQREMANPDEINHAQVSFDIASEILKKYKINGEISKNILNCISAHRFRKNRLPETIEAKVLFDADKLDSIGAIGVARAYAWAGKQSIKLYSSKNYLGTGYEKEHSPVTEFRYKLSHVKDKLFTKTAKKMAEQRHAFMESFFKQLMQEVYYNNNI